MNEKIRTIRLYGKLGTQFGRVHRLAVDSPAEAMRALCSQIRGLEAELIGSKDKGIKYATFVGKRNISENELLNPVGNEDIRIAPIYQGNKRGGFFQTVIGVTLIAAAVFIPGAQFLMQPGIALTLGGVIQMLSPTQTGLSSADGPDNGASYNFNSPVNTTAQGNAVPIVYGRMTIGGATLSAAVVAEDQA